MSKKILTTDEAEQQMSSQQSQQVSARDIKPSPALSKGKNNKLIPTNFNEVMQILEESNPDIKYGDVEPSNQAHSAEPILSSRGKHNRNRKSNVTNETDGEIPTLLNMKEKIQEELKKSKRPGAEEMKQQRAASAEVPSAPEITRKKAITLLGAANGKIGELVKKMDKQYELTMPSGTAENGQTFPMQGADQEAAILEQTGTSWKSKTYLMKRYCDLVHLNKYVGYASKKVKISLDFTRARLLLLKDEFLGKGKDDIKVRIKIGRIQGSVKIIDKSKKGQDQLKEIKRAQLRMVRLPDLEAGSPDGPSPPSVQTEAEKQTHSGVSFGTQLDWLRTASRLGALPQKYRYPIALLTETQDIMLFAATRPDRDIIVHELNSVCQRKNEEVLLLSARQDVMHLIDPIDSFNAYNLSMMCAPMTAEQDSFNRTGLRLRKDDIQDQEQIIKADQNFVEYVRDGVRCYVSQTLRRELWITDGTLFKEPKKSVRVFKKKYYGTFAVLDFKRLLVRFKKPEQDVVTGKRSASRMLQSLSTDSEGEFERAVKGPKDIAFNEIIEVRSLNLDVFRGEHQEIKQLPFKCKFMVRTLEREHVYFAKTEKERQIWLEGFSKILEYNSSNNGQFNLRSAPSMVHIKDQTTSIATTMKDTSTTTKIDGADVYKSPDLQVTKFAIVGHVMKAVENIGFFHKDKYHKRYLKIEFDRVNTCIYENEKKSEPQRVHKTQDLISCELIAEEELKERLDEREGKRSSSFFRRAMQKEVKRCSWNFAFKLCFQDKEYELYSATRGDREQWVKILSTIAEMNRQGVESRETNPLDYIRQQEEKAKQLLEEEKMTETARQRKSDEELMKDMNDQVNLWLKLNQEFLTKQKPVVDRYESKYLKSNAEFVRGLAYVIGRQSEQMAALPNSTLPVGAIKFFNIEMYLNFKTQVLQVQQKDLETITKLTFNEIDLAEPYRLTIKASEFEANQIDPPIWDHCFRLSMRGKPEHVIACASEKDRDEWLRYYNLIIQMKTVGLDSMKINIFTFEKHREQQRKIIGKRIGLIDDDEDSNNEEGAQEEAKQGGQAHHPGGMSRSISAIRRRSYKASRINQENIQKYIAEIGTVETPTIRRAYHMLEGWLCKEIQNQGVFQKYRRHLRYFRIVYNTGKLNIKEDKGRREMRSFQLRDLISIQVSGLPTTAVADTAEPERKGIMTKAEVLSSDFAPHEKWVKKDYTSSKDWPYTFEIKFQERSFVLNARTRLEMQEWVGLFNTVLKMNKIGLSVSAKNPYLFDREEKNAMAKERIELINVPIKESRKDNLVGNNDSARFQTADPFKTVQNEIAPGGPPAELMNNFSSQRQQQNTESAPRLNRFANSSANIGLTNNGPIKALHESASSNNVVNYNINVHNITIQHIGGGQNKPDAAQPENANNAYGNAPIAPSPRRVNSVDVIADLQSASDLANNSHMLQKDQSFAYSTIAGGDESNQFYRGRLKKKKKVKKLRRPSIQNSESVLGGVTEYDNFSIERSPADGRMLAGATDLTQVQCLDKLNVQSDFEDSDGDDAKEISQRFINRKQNKKNNAASAAILKKQQSLFALNEPSNEQVFQVSAIDHIVSFQDDSFEEMNGDTKHAQIEPTSAKSKKSKAGENMPIQVNFFNTVGGADPSQRNQMLIKKSNQNAYQERQEECQDIEVEDFAVEVQQDARKRPGYHTHTNSQVFVQQQKGEDQPLGKELQKISLNKIRLAGSIETIKSIDQNKVKRVKKAKNKPDIQLLNQQVNILAQDQEQSSRQKQVPLVDMDQIKSIAQRNQSKQHVSSQRSHNEQGHQSSNGGMFRRSQINFAKDHYASQMNLKNGPDNYHSVEQKADEEQFEIPQIMFKQSKKQRKNDQFLMNQVQNKMEIAKRHKKVKNEFPANSFTSDLKENADLEEYLEASQRESNNLPNFDDSAVLSDWD